jgi:hypothetical protein
MHVAVGRADERVAVDIRGGAPAVGTTFIPVSG